MYLRSSRQVFDVYLSGLVEFTDVEQGSGNQARQFDALYVVLHGVQQIGGLVDGFLEFSARVQQLHLERGNGRIELFVVGIGCKALGGLVDHAGSVIQVGQEKSG
ncbi:MAG: hypothetical protein BWY72_02031 [Bacteroidetes bacterium ADurb.Bin416]|nr:MAG: hypothetical protein BWY72_02031 [Bacteroidetes bacterium ADurb.Bin416]